MNQELKVLYNLQKNGMWWGGGGGGGGMNQELKVLYNLQIKRDGVGGNEARIEGIVQFTKTKRDGVGE